MVIETVIWEFTFLCCRIVLSADTCCMCMATADIPFMHEDLSFMHEGLSFLRNDTLWTQFASPSLENI